MTIKLPKRLLSIANMLPQDISLADIGADRGELSLYILKTKKCNKLVLSDISKSSLSRACDLFGGLGLLNEASIRLGSGITVLSPYEVDYVVLAGMGGGTIINIFNESPDVFCSLTGIIVQPMRDGDKVRKYLTKNGFMLIDEELVYEKGKYYTVMHFVAGTQVLTPIEEYCGKILLEKKDPLLRGWILKQKEILADMLQYYEDNSIKEQRIELMLFNMKLLEEALLWLD